MRTLISIVFATAVMAGAPAFAQSETMTAKPMAQGAIATPKGSMTASPVAASSMMAMSDADKKALDACRKLTPAQLAKDAKCKAMVAAHPMPMAQAGAMASTGSMMSTAPKAK